MRWHVALLAFYVGLVASGADGETQTHVGLLVIMAMIGTLTYRIESAQERPIEITLNADDFKVIAAALAETPAKGSLMVE